MKVTDPLLCESGNLSTHAGTKIYQILANTGGRMKLIANLEIPKVFIVLSDSCTEELGSISLGAY